MKCSAGQFLQLDSWFSTHRPEVAPIHVPPLRDRPEDIPALVAHFLDLHAEGRPRLEEAALEALQQHDWPGNVRELEHALQRAALLAPSPRVAWARAAAAAAAAKAAAAPSAALDVDLS